MSDYGAALAVEALKARRSKVVWLCAVFFTILPLVGGLFMVILKDPEGAQQMGLIGQKARIAAGTADWPALLGLLTQGMGAGGLVVFAFVTAWVFGREFSDKTVRTLLALPTPRWAVVAAKATVVLVACALMSVWCFGLGIVVGKLVHIPGWSAALVLSKARMSLVVIVLTIGLQSVTALVASAGRGYLAPVGFILACLGVGNLLGVMGHGAWFPWAIPMLYTGAAGPHGESVGAANFALVVLTALLGLAATFAWWERADQAG